MRHIKGRGTSMMRKLMIPMIVVLLLQTSLFGGSIILGGILDQMNQNAVDILNERVINRKNYLENEMIQRWSKLDDSVQSIQSAASQTLAAKGASYAEIENNPALASKILEANSQNVIYMLRKQSVTGAFLILDTDRAGDKKAGIYFRDLDPLSNADDDSDIMVEVAPSEITQKLGISMDTNWSPQFDLTQTENTTYDFYYKPYRAAQEYPDIQYGDLGYWSRPFRLSPNDIEIMTYSVPLRAESGETYGVLGVEISTDYIKKLLPYDEIANDKTGSYLLGLHTADDSETLVFENLLANGPVYKQQIGSEETTSFALQTQYGTCHQIQQQGNMTKDVYGCIQYFQLYNSNTPFVDEQWGLVGILEGDRLFSFSEAMRKTVLIAVGIVLLIGLLSVVIMTRIVTNPITQLVKKVRSSNPHLPVKFERTRIAEIDELASAVESLSSNVAESASRLSAIIESASVAIGAFEYRKDEKTVIYTKHFFEIVGIAHDNEKDYGYMDADTFTQIMQGLKDCLESIEPEGAKIYKIKDALGQSQWVRMKQIEQGDNKIYGIIENITQEVIEKRKIEYERDYDLLTNLLNRRAFYARLDQLFLNKDQLKCSAMVMFDLDNLKYINDTYGHDFGDQYIRCMARTLKKYAPRRAVISRVSGDEFYLFIYGYAQEARAFSAIQNMREQISNTLFPLPDNALFKVKASAGVSWYPKDANTYEELIRFADFAMYTVKHTVKGEVRQFDRNEYQAGSYILENSEEINRFIEEKLFEYHFQPIVDAHDGKIFAYEALIRSKSASLITPQEILTLARSQSKLYQIERLTWFNAMDAFANLEGVEGSCHIFINSIANQTLSLQDLALFEKRYERYLSRIVVELTEEEKQNDVFVTLKKEYTKKWGAALALDDYGTGYNGEAMLLYLSPQYVKIDMSIVRDIDIDEDRQKILSNLLSYTRERGIQVIAEGVETRSEMDTLIRCGVSYLQGYYLGEPALHAAQISNRVLNEIRQAQREV